MHFKNAYVDKSVMFAISQCDTTMLLGISFKPYANSIHDTKYHKWCTSLGGQWCQLYYKLASEWSRSAVLFMSLTFQAA